MITDGADEPEKLDDLRNSLQDPAADHANLQQHQLDGGWRAWSSVFSAFLQASLSLGLPNSFGVYQSEYVSKTYPRNSEAEITFIGSLYLVAMCSACLVGGRPCELIGIRKTFLIGGALLVIGMFTASWCHSIGTLIVTQGIIAGLGGGLLYTTGSALPAQWFTHRTGLAVGLAASGSGAGGIAFSYITRAFIDAYGVAWSLRITAFISIGVLAVSFATMRVGSTSTRRAASHSFWKVTKVFAVKRWVLVFYIAFVIYVFGFMNVPFFLPSYIQTQGGASATTGGSISAVYNAGAILGRNTLGLLADRVFGILNTFIIFMTAAGVLQLTMWLPADGNITTSFIFAFLYGFCGSGALGISPTILARHLDPDSFAAIIGIFYTSEIPGYAGGGPLAGVVLAKGGYKALIRFSGGAQTLGMSIAIISRFIMNRKVFVKV